jgi:hypothetical protein
LGRIEKPNQHLLLQSEYFVMVDHFAMDVYHPSGVLSPPPLQIIKHGRRRPNENCSPRHVSTGTFGSLGSAPDFDEVDYPLTIIKKRGHGRSQIPDTKEKESNIGDLGSHLTTNKISSFS